MDAARLHPAGRSFVHSIRLAIAVTLAATVLSACSISLPAPDAAPASSASPSSAPAKTYAAPTISPGHDAKAVASRPMTFAAGAGLAADPVGFADGMADARGWKQTKSNEQGTSEYRSTDGCILALHRTVNQTPLAVSGDDKASTEALFVYLDPSLLPSYLVPASLNWSNDPATAGPRVDFLSYTPPPKTGAPSSFVYARLFANPASGLLVSGACPDGSRLPAVQRTVQEHVSVVPPGL